MQLFGGQLSAGVFLVAIGYRSMYNKIGREAMMTGYYIMREI